MLEWWFGEWRTGERLAETSTRRRDIGRIRSARNPAQPSVSHDGRRAGATGSAPRADEAAGAAGDAGDGADVVVDTAHVVVGIAGACDVVDAVACAAAQVVGAVGKATTQGGEGRRWRIGA